MTSLQTHRRSHAIIPAGKRQRFAIEALLCTCDGDGPHQRTCLLNPKVPG